MNTLSREAVGRVAALQPVARDDRPRTVLPGMTPLEAFMVHITNATLPKPDNPAEGTTAPKAARTWEEDEDDYDDEDDEAEDDDEDEDEEDEDEDEDEGDEDEG